MKRSFALALTIAAAVAVQIYIVSLPHEHPCPPPDTSMTDLAMKATASVVKMRSQIGELERELADAKAALRASEHKRWLQNGVHGE